MSRELGVSLVELLVVVALLGIVVLSGIAYVNSMAAPVDNSGSLLEGLLIQARARAITSTTARRVRPSTADELIVESADSCASSTWTTDPQMSVELVRGVTLASTTWTVCFSRRGIASDNVLITLNHPGGASQILEVLRGGVVRWME